MALIAENRQNRVNQIRGEATILFSGRYQIACQPEIVAQAIDHPLLLGALWSLYGFAPAYKISRTDKPGALHVDDPTGIVGDILLVSTNGARRIYLAEGMLNHWAVPMLKAGSAVFEIEIHPKRPETLIAVDIFIKPETRLAGAILWALSPLVKVRVQNRISLNLQDMEKILIDIAQSPEKIAGSLQGDFQYMFNLAFDR